ncbi:anti-anti-sigma factor [Lentzea xinjiangensis]|uniref:Anti-anti-sigma factor n=1 Tax=Lentzea xinjiangensis TaxID=402600 RepID=A0A1H9JVC5_9PSEU|nr:STAS domain-containing protein [Lentzea xinjiangensis]SEQ90876.1 anti-anti-sigma factor [Lentzea xinjiangensis]
MSRQSDGGVSVLTARAVDHDGIAVVVVSGEIDRITENSPLDEAFFAVRQSPAGLVIDLDGVTFFGSAGINMLVAVRREAASAGVPFAVVAETRLVLRPLEVSGVDALLSVHPALPDALAALRSAQPSPR